MPKQLYIASQAIVPMRKDPSESSEMVSQLLWGEYVTVTQSQGNWYRITSLSDQYSGWIDTKMITPMGDHDFSPAYVSSLFAVVKAVDTEDYSYYLSMGSMLPFYNEEERTFRLGHTTYSLLSGDAERPLRYDLDLLRAYALSLINTPYLWGGKHSMGIDCSGFVQLVYRLCAVNLPRDAYAQAECGDIVSFAERRPGDIVFFDNDAGRVIHVGILFDEDKIIHCSGCVHIDILDQKGIVRQSDGVYSHRLHSLRRIQ